MSSTETTGRRGSPAWMKILLVLSLAANLAVIGVVLGHSLRDSEDRGRGSERVINWIIDMMPEERREMARRHFEAGSERIDAARAERRSRLPAVIAAIRAEPFDPQALNDALEAMYDRDTSRWTIMREQLITLLAQLAPAERAAFAEQYEERLGARDGHKGG